MTDVNEEVIAEFRASAGLVLEAMGGHFNGVQLLLLHTTGRRSGRHHVTPLVYIEDGGRGHRAPVTTALDRAGQTCCS